MFKEGDRVRLFDDNGRVIIGIIADTAYSHSINKQNYYGVRPINGNGYFARFEPSLARLSIEDDVIVYN